MMRINVGTTAALIGAFGLMVQNPAAAESTIRACIGENNCPVAVQAMFACGSTVDTVAASVCTITRNGQRTVSAYRIILQGSHEGDHCGYRWFQVVCLDN